MKLLLVALLLAGLTACDDEPSGAPGLPDDPGTAAAGARAPTATATAGTSHRPGLGQPPPYRVRYAGHELALYPHTYCYGNGCVDGFSDDPPRIGAPGEIEVLVPVDDFRLRDVGFVADGCHEPETSVSAQPLGAGRYRIVAPAIPGGTYTVGLFARGRSGDMIAEFRWRMTGAAGATPTATACPSTE